ncbi:MAG: YqgE/AlgH family protein [Bacteroidota bacterium]|nr:YqgE/AlgH family protein [Bacteroidota bacterium]
MEFKEDFFKLKYNKIPPVKGCVLVSEPYSGDYFFERSVVLLAEHDETGTVGFILNKRLNKSLDEITDYFGNFSADVNFGGPVGEQNLYYIHSLGTEIEGSIKISDQLYWGGNFEMVKELSLLGKLNETNIKFFVGYSGWAKGQLDDEIKRDSWLVADISEKEIMAPAPKIWKSVLNKLERKYRIWSNFPLNPESN